MNKDEIKGQAEEAKGKLKKLAGDLTDDEELQSEGAVDEAKGEARQAFGRGKRKVGEAIEDIGKAVKRH